MRLVHYNELWLVTCKCWHSRYHRYIQYMILLMCHAVKWVSYVGFNFSLATPVVCTDLHLWARVSLRVQDTWAGPNCSLNTDRCILNDSSATQLLFACSIFSVGLFLSHSIWGISYQVDLPKSESKCISVSLIFVIF